MGRSCPAAVVTMAKRRLKGIVRERESERRRMRSGDFPGLQTRRATAKVGAGGFDSHTPPPGPCDVTGGARKVERLFAWLQNFRRVVVRYGRYLENYLGFVQLGCMVILLRNYF